MMIYSLYRWVKNWWLAGILLTIAFFFRIYRLGDLLGFYFDQGRDAIVIREFLNNHKWFLVGPTTGIEGIFLGPFYYLTLIPWYWLGRGNPVFPAVYIAMTTVLALVVMGKLANDIFGKKTAYIFIILGGFSYWLIVASRWLSNPTQLMLASSIIVWSLWRVIKGDLRCWVLVALGLGVSLQLEAASAFFFIPTVLIFMIWKREMFPRGWVLVVSVGIFLLSLLPQVWFDIRHGHLMLKSFSRFLLGEQSFRTSLLTVFVTRASFYWHALWSKVFANEIPFVNLLTFVILGSVLFVGRKLRSDGAKLLVLWLFAPLVGLLFYQGNYGYVWDYYLTGIYLTFILLVSAIVSGWTRSLFGKAVYLVFMMVFIWINLPVLRNYLVAGTDGPTNVVLGNERQAVLWVLSLANQEGKPYNTDVYVPPVIPYAYDYLISWLSSNSLPPTSFSAPRLYTIYEVDTPHPERLAAWLSRQERIGTVEKIATFGGVTVEQRTRIK